MSWSGLAKFLLGFILAIAILIGGGVAAALYYMNRVSIPPAKPIFENDKPTLETQRPPHTATVKSKPLPAAQPSPKPSPKPLETRAYKARVIWSGGLSLRSEPNLASEQIGRLSHNQSIVVLEESADKNWQRVRLEGSEKEGWIKAGNTKRVNKQQ